MLSLLKRLSFNTEESRNDFLNYELDMPGIVIKNKLVDLNKENIEFKSFLKRQRSLIKNLQFYQNLYGIEKVNTIDIHAYFILQQLYNIRENNYFNFYFSNNQVNLKE